MQLCTSTVTPKFMKAVLVYSFGGPKVMEVKEDIPVPIPKEDEVLVKVGAIGVNPLDTYIRSGKFSPLPTLPYTPGDDMCGTVESLGENVLGFEIGDRVCSFMSVSGTYAEFSVVNQKHLLKVPKDYDFAKGAAVGIPYLTAYRTRGVKPGETMLIHGASGGVGIATAQLAISRGISVIGTAGSKEGIELVKKVGVDRVFNHRADGYTDRILESTHGQGVDAIVEMLANVNLKKDLEMLKQKGQIFIVGSRGLVEINPREMLAKETNVQGISLWLSTDEEFQEACHVITAGLAQGWLDPVIGQIYSLNEVQQAHEDLIKNSGTRGKMIIVI